MARVKDTFSQVSLCTAIPIGWHLLRIGGMVGKNYRLVVSPHELGSAAGTTSMTHLPAPALTSLCAS